MKPDIDKKFDSLRNAPTELSKEQVESIIKGLPHLPSTPVDTTNWTSWFSLNNLLMVSFAGAVAAGMLLWNKNTDQSDVFISNEVSTQTPFTPLDNAPISTDAVPEKMEVSTPITKTEKVSDETLLVANTDLKPTSSKVELKPNPPIKVTEKQTVSKPVTKAVDDTPVSLPKPEKAAATDLKTENNPTIDQKIPEITFNRNGTSVPQKAIETDPNAVPDLTNGEMRRLKKSLFKNLFDDALIINRWKEVQIELPGNEIIVNGKVLDKQLFKKYSLLTKKVGWGPDRKIKFDDEYIKLGDFTATGFKGSGFGMFRSTPKRHMPDEGVNSENLAINRNRAIKKEQRELDAFSQTLLDTSTGRRGRKNILSVNLKKDKCKKLHKELYGLLLEDGLLESKTDFVLIEISKKSIHINVMELNEVLYEKYSELFDSYHIRPGPRRQVRMSVHTIRVGDFSRGSFTGTSVTF